MSDTFTGSISRRPKVQERVDGELVREPGPRAAYGVARLRMAEVGDSNTADPNHREALFLALRRRRGGVDLVGSQGMPPNASTGGIIGRRALGSWEHDGFSGRRVTRSFAATVDPVAGTITAAGHDLADGVAFVLQGLSGITGLTNGTLYYARDTSGSTFKPAAYQGGPALTFTGSAGAATLGTGLVQLLPGIVQKWRAAPTLLLLRGITNDIFGGATAEQARDAMAALIDTALAAGPWEVLVCAPPPITPGTVSGVGWGTYAAVRDAYVALLPALVQSKGGRVGYVNACVDIGPAMMSSDGVHPSALGYASEAGYLSTAIYRIAGDAYQGAYPRPFRARAAEPSFEIGAAGTSCTIPYHPDLSPGRDAAGAAVEQSAVMALWFYPTTLVADSNFRAIVHYGDAHPAGFLFGTFANTSPGGVSFYVGSSGAPVISGVGGGYAAEALKLGRWHRIYLVIDRPGQRVGVFIGIPPGPVQLIAWAPVPAAWTTPDASTRIGFDGTFTAQPGYVNGYTFWKAPDLDALLEQLERDYHESAPPQSAVHYPINAGIGLVAAPANYGLPNGVLNTSTWVTNVPKEGITEVLAGTGTAESIVAQESFVANASLSGTGAGLVVGDLLLIDERLVSDVSTSSSVGLTILSATIKVARDVALPTFARISGNASNAALRAEMWLRVDGNKLSVSGTEPSTGQFTLNHEETLYLAPGTHTIEVVIGRGSGSSGTISISPITLPTRDSANVLSLVGRIGKR